MIPETTTRKQARSDVLETATRLRLTTGRLARQLRQQAAGGLSPSQLSALASIDWHGPLTLGKLARREQVAPPTITKVAAKLEEQGLVRRQVDDADRRVVRVEITAAGRRLLAHTRSRRNAWLARRLRALQEADPGALTRLEAALPVLEALAEAPDEADEPPRPDDVVMATPADQAVAAVAAHQEGAVDTAVTPR
jgi:DNA-binding MarR family transcriptional regulator